MQIYNEVGREEASYHMAQASTDEEKAALLAELANRPESELLEYLDQVVDMLRMSTSSDVKKAVCQAVSNAGSSGIAYCQDIAYLLQDPDPEVKYTACITLAVQGPMASIAQPSVENLLGDQSDAVRCGACAALGAFEARESIAKLKALLTDKSPEVQGAACMALGKLGEAGAQSASDVAEKLDEPRSRLQALYALGSMGEEGSKFSEKVIDCITDDDAEVRLAAAQQAGQMAAAVKDSGTAWGKLSGLTANSDGYVRCAAALAVGYMGEHGADLCDSLKDLLSDDFADAGVNALTVGGCRSRMPPSTRKAKCAGAAGLGLVAQSGAEVAVDVYASEVASLLNDEDWEVRMVACESLAMMGEKAKDQATKLSAIFDDEKYAVRAKAAHACGKLKDADVASGLADLIADSCPSVVEEAMLALAELGDDGAEYIEKIFEKINAYSPTVRAAAITSLGKIGEKGHFYAGAVAQRLMEYEAPFVRVAAIEALGNMEDHGAVYAEVVADFLQDQLPQVRAAAAASLGKMGPEGEAFAPDIKALTNDPVGEVQKAAGQAVATLKV